MRTYSMVCSEGSEIVPFIEEHKLYEYDQILVQIHSAVFDSDYIRAAINEIKRLLPNAMVIGMTAKEGIINDTITNKGISISFSVFKNTTIQAISILHNEVMDSFILGECIAKRITREQTKVIILYINSFAIDTEKLLKGIRSIAPKKMVIVGGQAGELERSEAAYIFSNEQMISSGVVAVSLNNHDLHVHTFTKSYWHEIGKLFTITKSAGNRLYELDGRPVLGMLNRYLGVEFTQQLPYSSSDFPFIIERDGHKTCFFITKTFKDGSVEVTGKIYKDDKLKFAYANIPDVFENSIRQIKKLRKKPVETIFLYNCMGMNRYLRDFTLHELRALHEIAPVVGVFTRGHFCSKNGNGESGTQSLTLLALSESVEVKEVPDTSLDYYIPETFQSMIALSHLINASSHDIDRLNSSIEISEQRYKSLFEHNTDIVYSTDLNGNFTSVNPAFVKMLGYKEEEILYTNSLKYINKEDIPRVKAHFFRALRGKVQYYDLEIPTKSGDALLFQVKNVPIIVNGEKVGIYGIGRDITEQKKAEEKIAYLAYYDTDTGLPNRTKFTELVTKHIGTAKQKKRKLAVLFIDMDRFKIINDSIGHYAGDEVLKQVAGRIKKVLPSGSYLGRFAGDKFSLLLTKKVDFDHVVQTAKKILQNVSKPILYENQEFFITASIGVSLYPNDGIDEHSLLKNADTAMNRAKQQGGNRIEFYSNDMNEQVMYRIELESYLRKALEKNEFFLMFQPLVDLETGVILGSEALLRWRHPKLGLVSPAEFIPLAEETGVIHDVGRWVLVNACKQTKVWQDMGLGPLTVSVNVSATQFQQRDFIEDVKSALAESALSPCDLNLELTESVMLRNISHSIELIRELQELGVRVSIDDFGTGYSSLNYLKNLPINTLKIDRSFIQHLHLDASDFAIVKAIVTMGHGLNLKVVAEGVENEEQIQLLKEFKCHYAQGYLLYKPMVAEELEQKMTHLNNILS